MCTCTKYNSGHNTHTEILLNIRPTNFVKRYNYFQALNKKCSSILIIRFEILFIDVLQFRHFDNTDITTLLT